MGALSDKLVETCVRGRFNVLRMPEAPRLEPDQAAAAELDRMLERTPEGGWIDYDSARPRHELLQRSGYFLHGSNDTEIDAFETRRQETYTGRMVEAVFATDDAIWAVFFAVVARPPVWSLRNACVTTGERRRYFFAIDADPRSEEPWTGGAVYLLPRETFEQTYNAEWISPKPVRPRARLAVTKDDFPFAHRVFRHRFGERDVAFLGRLARAGLAGKPASPRNV